MGYIVGKKRKTFRMYILEVFFYMLGRNTLEISKGLVSMRKAVFAKKKNEVMKWPRIYP